MKNLLFIVPSLKRAGGAETQIIDLVNNIDNTKYNIHLVSFSPKLDQLGRIDNTRVSYHHVLRKSKFHLGFIFEIAKIINNNNIDLLHCTLQFSLLVAWFARLSSKRRPALVDVIHTTINKGVKQEIQDILIYQWPMRLCKKIIFVCNNQRLYWEGKYPFIKKTSTVIYNGIDEDYFDPEPWRYAGKKLRKVHNVPDDGCLLACIAGFRIEKAHHLLIEALDQSVDNLYLLLAGEGVQRGVIEELVKSKGLQGRVFFLGMLHDVRPVLAAANATVLTSISVETFSIAMLESMAMETPMISSNIGGMSEAINDDVTGWLVQPGDVTQLSDIMNRIAADLTITEKAGVQARIEVVKRFSQVSMADKTENIFDEVLA